MTHSATNRDTGTGYGGDSPPHPVESEATRRPYFHQREHITAPPHRVPVFQAAPPSQGPNYLPPQWNAPPLPASVQEQRYDVLFANDAAWSDVGHSSPTSAIAPYANYNPIGGNTSRAAVYQQDNRTSAGNGQLSADVQHVGGIEFGATYGSIGTQNMVGTEGQPRAQTAEAPAPSGSLKSFARRYILDPGTRIDTVYMGSTEYGRLKVIITLEAADGV